jgi:hypothetical protein
VDRHVHKTRHSDSQVTYRLRIDDEPCEPNSRKSFKRLFSFLQTLADSPSLLQCGPDLVESFTVYHNGSMWSLKAELTVHEPVME